MPAGKPDLAWLWITWAGHSSDVFKSSILPSMTMVPEALGTSIRLYLADGRADGFRLVEKSNWTGLGLVSSRSDYPRVRKRDEYTRPGVYLLTGPPSGTGLKDQLYIGEADDVRDRVDQHLKNKEFWTAVVAFTSKDENLNKAHVRYLEARLVQLASKAGRVKLLNGTVPALPKLSEADRADMEAYLREMLVILPLLGVVAFEEIDTQAPPANQLHLKGKGAQATGADTPEGFVVFEGSLARIDSVPSIHAYMAAQRERLRAEGVLVPDGGHLRFTRAHLFDSPSTAAGVILGRTANGRIEWKNASGQTLKDMQEAALQETSSPSSAGM
jgi:hypothetical protein